MLGTLMNRIIAVLALVLLICVGGWGFLQYERLQKSTAEKAEAIQQREAAISARDRAITATFESEKVIKQLQAEKEAAEQAIANLKSRQRQDAVTIGKLTDIINTQAANPANHAELSPVLKSIVEQIDKDRLLRGKK